MDNSVSQVHLIPIPAAIVPDWWDNVREMVEECCSRSNGKYHISDVLYSILAKKMQLWIALGQHEISAVGISELVQYPQVKVCRMLAVTGEDRELWIHLIEDMEAWGRQQGAEDMELIARPGWAREMKKYGFVCDHVILHKRLANVH